MCNEDLAIVKSINQHKRVYTANHVRNRKNRSRLITGFAFGKALPEKYMAPSLEVALIK